MARKRKSGYSLVEMLVYVSLLAVAFTLCMKIFVSGTRLSALNTLAMDRINGLAEVEREFRQAVRGAYAVVPKAASHKSDEQHVVLRLSLPEAPPRYLVLGALRDPHHLSAMELAEQDGALTASKFVTYRVALAPITFEYDAPSPAEARLVRMTVMIHKAPGERMKNPVTHHFVAALRGIAQP